MPRNTLASCSDAPGYKRYSEAGRVVRQQSVGRSSEDVGDELLVVEGSRLVLVGQRDHPLQLVVAEVGAELVEDGVQLAAVDVAAAVLVELAKHRPQSRLPAAAQRPLSFHRYIMYHVRYALMLYDVMSVSVCL